MRKLKYLTREAVKLDAEVFIIGGKADTKGSWEIRLLTELGLIDAVHLATAMTQSPDYREGQLVSVTGRFAESLFLIDEILPIHMEPTSEVTVDLPKAS